MSILDLQIACDDPHPDAEAFQTWVDAALAGRRNPETELTIRVVDSAESAELNERYRGKNGPTNVLSFPFEAPPETPLDLIGDLVICAPVIAAEAAEQDKTAAAHWAHITVHGVLHLLGYDHVDEAEAELMETLEVAILSRLNIANPYQENSP